MVDADLQSSKYAASQQKRLQSLRDKQELHRKKQQLVSEALKSVDDPNARSNKRIVFDSDSDGEKEVVPKIPKMVHKKLFEESDDEHPDIEKEDGDVLISTGRITGKGSQRLMELQSTYGYDSRFQLDNTFLEDNEKEDNIDVERAQEKERQLRLLSMVVGRDVKPRQEATVKKSNVRPFHRFDPDNEQHVEWMKNFSKQQAPESDEDEAASQVEIDNEIRTEEPSKPIVDERRFYAIDQDFAAELRAKLVSGQKGTYSFLNEPSNTTHKVFHDNDNDKEEENISLKEKIASDVSEKPHSSKNAQRISETPCFFFETTDSRLSSKLNSFYGTIEPKSRLRKWVNARDSFKSLARQVRKKRMREIDIKKT